MEKVAMEIEEYEYQMFLIKVREDELHMLAKEQAEAQRRIIKQSFKHKGDYSP